ncbi:MAG: 50S ribosomal protein L6 [Candidatus Micrarchaeota archaeon]
MKVKIPEGVSVSIDGSKFIVKGKSVSLEKPFNPLMTTLKVEGNEVDVSIVGKPNKKKNAIANAVVSHLKNMIHGTSHEFEKKLKLVFAHFPVTLEVKGNQMLIKNFLGEKTPRTAVISAGVKVQAKGADVTVSGHDKELVGQTAANIIKATRVTNRDERIFQDGIYHA